MKQSRNLLYILFLPYCEIWQLHLRSAELLVGIWTGWLGDHNRLSTQDKVLLLCAKAVGAFLSARVHRESTPQKKKHMYSAHIKCTAY
jgi:hypothetical protein